MTVMSLTMKVKYTVYKEKNGNMRYTIYCKKNVNKRCFSKDKVNQMNFISICEF